MSETIEPCPNPECHSGTTAVISDDRVPAFLSVCCACGYQGPHAWRDGETAIAMHNRIARAVREASELSHLAGHYLTRAEKAEAERDALRVLIEQHNREWPEAQEQRERAEPGDLERRIDEAMVRVR